MGYEPTGYGVARCAINGCKEWSLTDDRPLGDQRFCGKHSDLIINDAISHHRVYYGVKIDTDDGLIKIGYSSDVPARAKALGINILATEPGGSVHEGLMHYKFSALRRWCDDGSEWFLPDPTLLKYIKGLNAYQKRQEQDNHWAEVLYGKDAHIKAMQSREWVGGESL